MLVFFSLIWSVSALAALPQVLRQVSALVVVVEDLEKFFSYYMNVVGLDLSVYALASYASDCHPCKSLLLELGSALKPRAASPDWCFLAEPAQHLHMTAGSVFQTEQQQSLVKKSEILGYWNFNPSIFYVESIHIIIDFPLLYNRWDKQILLQA